ncbi:glycosyltransferase family 2 protein [Olivibacter sp. SDN3]|uniref:glycosyltransferase family 2 protein n=1 Tax=Olivibacter sp. SDN3 TaxID=2764720 RepID=UPI001650FBE9|nr:glycosyltransferase family 2 protein [Olivibacter sp. SDN3]QNL51589.1 glycosyltransferase family 2 protein [Olivibacter sp. SDN3]
MASLALVTVLYKSDDVLEGFIKSISRQSFTDYHLYVVDNSAAPHTDRLLTQLLTTYPVSAFTHIRNDDNYGAAKGNNQGIAAALAADSSYILLLNNDIEIPSPHLLAQLFQEAVRRQEQIIIPKLLYYDTRAICMAGGHLNHRTAVTVHIGAGEPDEGQYNTPGYCNYGPTTFMLLSREVLTRVGYIDERYFAYYEDTDFIYRATQLGYSIYYQPHLEVLHKESSLTGGLRSPFFIYYINRNRLYFIRKNFKGLQKVGAFASMGLDFLRMFRHYSHVQRKVLIKAMCYGLFASSPQAGANKKLASYLRTRISLSRLNNFR